MKLFRLFLSTCMLWGVSIVDMCIYVVVQFNSYFLIIFFMIMTLENKPFLSGHLNGGSSKPFLWFCELIPYLHVSIDCFCQLILCKMQENTSFFFQARSSSIELTFLNVRPEIIIISNYFKYIYMYI